MALVPTTLRYTAPLRRPWPPASVSRLQLGRLAAKTIDPHDNPHLGAYIPPDSELVLGAIIGSVDVVDCVTGHPSAWAEPGQYHWVLANPRPLATPVPCRGMPGLFYPRQPVYAALRAA